MAQERLKMVIAEIKNRKGTITSAQEKAYHESERRWKDDPTRQDVLAALQTYDRLEQWDRAVRLLESRLGHHPVDPKLQLELAKAHLRLNNRTAVATAMDYAAHILVEFGLRTKALAIYQKMLELELELPEEEGP